MSVKNWNEQIGKPVGFWAARPFFYNIPNPSIKRYECRTKISKPFQCLLPPILFFYFFYLFSRLPFFFFFLYILTLSIFLSFSIRRWDTSQVCAWIKLPIKPRHEANRTVLDSRTNSRSVSSKKKKKEKLLLFSKKNLFGANFDLGFHCFFIYFPSLLQCMRERRCNWKGDFGDFILFYFWLVIKSNGYERRRWGGVFVSRDGRFGVVDFDDRCRALEDRLASRKSCAGDLAVRSCFDSES